MTREIVSSTCTECLVHCGISIYIEDGMVAKISGNKRSPTSEGIVCVKGIHGPTTIRESPTRLLYPLRRRGDRGDGNWERITWSEAHELIADDLERIKANYGAAAIAGTAATFTQSRGTAVRLLLRALGSPNFMINQDMCHGGRSTAALLTGFGGIPGSELSKARAIMVVGRVRQNPTSSNGCTFRGPRLRARN